MTSQTDRALSFILSFPPFTDDTARGLGVLKIRSAAILLELPDDNAAWRDLVIGKADSMPDDSPDRALLLDELDNLCLIRSLAMAQRATIREMEFLDIEYAPSVPSSMKHHLAPPPISHWSLARRTKARSSSELTMATLNTIPMAPPISLSSDGDNPGEHALRARDEAARERWVAALLETIARAGSASTISSTMEARYSDRAAPILKLLLGKGAINTMKSHITRWKALETWFDVQPRHDLVTLYPPSPALIGRYLDFRIANQAGHTVADSICGSIVWICERLGMETPDVCSPDLQALREAQSRKRSRGIKQSPAYPPELIKAMETKVGNVSDPDDPGSGSTAIVILFCELLRVFSSLRFDDLQHMRPQDAAISDVAFTSYVYQSKTDQRRVGRKIVAIRAGLSIHDWQRYGWNVFRHFCPGRRDFWLPAIHEDPHRPSFILDEPMEYAQYDRLSRAARLYAVDSDPILSSDLEFMSTIANITLHGAKASMITMMAHAGADPLAIKRQGNWKSDSMPAVYTRNSEHLSMREAIKAVNHIKDSMPPPSRFKSSKPCTIRTMVQPEFRTDAKSALYAAYCDGKEMPDAPNAAMDDNSTDKFINTEEGKAVLDDWLSANPDKAASDTDVVSESVDSATTDDTDDELPPTFYKCRSKSESVSTIGTDGILKWHAAHPTEADTPACNIRGIKLSDMIPLGRAKPSAMSCVCARCLKQRPDIHALF